MSDLIDDVLLKKLIAPEKSKNGLYPGNASPATPRGALAKSVEEKDTSLINETDPYFIEQEHNPGNALAVEITTLFQKAKSHRLSSGITDRVVANNRLVKGEYTCEEKEMLGGVGNDVWFPLSARLSRVLKAFLENILNPAEHRLWDFEATPIPDVPETLIDEVTAALVEDLALAMFQGEQVGELDAENLIDEMVVTAKAGLKQEVENRVDKQRDTIDDQLVDAHFMTALKDFLHDLTISPYAVMRGWSATPGIKTRWKNGRLVTDHVKTMKVCSVDPINFFWTSDCSNTQDGTGVFEISPMTRSELNASKGFKHFIATHIDQVLRDYSYSDRDWLNTSGEPELDELLDMGHAWESDDTIDVIRYHGKIEGHKLIGVGLENLNRDMSYECVVWVAGNLPIFAKLNDSPGVVRPYHIASLYPTPGAMTGGSLPDAIEDLQRTANSCLRSMIRNLSFASAPIFEMDVAKMADGYDIPDNIVPGMMLYRNSLKGTGDGDMLSMHKIPGGIQEFQAMLMSVIEQAEMTVGLPRFLMGQPGGGAARTLGGLTTLQNNASVGLQAVLKEIDRVIGDLIKQLYLFNMAEEKDDDRKADANIVVFGASHLLSKSVNKGRLMEALNVAAPFMQSGFIDPKGTASILKEMFDEMGLKGDEVVIDQDQAQAQSGELQAQLQNAGGVSGGVTNPQSLGA